GRVLHGLPEMDPAHLAEGAQLVAQNRQRHHPDIAHVDAGGEKPPQEGALQHARGEGGVASDQDVASLGERGAVGAAQLGHELRGELDVGEPLDHLPLEERLLPALAPDQVPGHGGAGLDHLARPDLDVALDVGILADGGVVGDHPPLLHHGGLPHAYVVADDAVVDLGPLLDVDVVPDHAARQLHPGSMVQLRPITLSLIWAPPLSWELSPITTVPSTRVPSPRRTSSPTRRSLPTNSFLGSSILTL